MEVSLAKRFILSVSMHGGRYFFIQPFLFFPDGRERGGTGIGYLLLDYTIC